MKLNTIVNNPSIAVALYIKGEYLNPDLITNILKINPNRKKQKD